MKVRSQCTFTHISVNLWFIFTQYFFFSALFFCRLFTCWWRLRLTCKKTSWKEAGWVCVTLCQLKFKLQDWNLWFKTYTSYKKNLFCSIRIKMLAALRSLNLHLKCLLANTSLLLQVLVCWSSSNRQETLLICQFKPMEERGVIFTVDGGT